MSAIPCPQAAALGGETPAAADPWVLSIENTPTFIRDPATVPPPQPPPAPVLEVRWPYHLPRWSAIDCLWWAMLVRAAYGPNDTFLRRVAEWAGPILRMTFLPPITPEVVSHALIELTDQWLMVIPGTTDDAERNRYILTHALAAVNRRDYPGGTWSINSTWAGRGEVIWAAAQAWPFPAAKPVTVIGHSAGGGAGAVAFIRHSLAANTGPRALVTYGSMIWGMPDTNTLLTSQKAQVIEFATPGDPIPLLPPPWSVIDLVRLPYPVQNRPTYVRAGALLELRGREGAVILRQPQSDLERIASAVISIMRGQLSPTEHSIRFYSRVALDWARQFSAQHGHRELLQELEVIQDDMREAGL